MFFFVLQVLPVLRRSPEGPGGFRDFADVQPHATIVYPLVLVACAVSACISVPFLVRVCLVYLSNSARIPMHRSCHLSIIPLCSVAIRVDVQFNNSPTWFLYIVQMMFYLIRQQYHESFILRGR
jgi:hypothetical protein